ncbi:TIGR01244 family sulfur transferase [Ruegeria sp. 2205SS24-7]|uniref:TIGR01244 family sulfur transferase n=1 Tax=Ruegeria discodermiae TaxID=3064389 RepID=UPI002740997F|nr:TIGR01244 family sulfur transferase [Ruegeria sp. 2205SS24-7]MDP5220310.1 TIGR01244 family sulfur transferase [Ruegeria sp. 2205SS24-7]
MDIRPITPRYAVSPQISVEDVPAIAEAGFTRVICNRPDIEVPPSHQADAIAEAVHAAGLEFEVLELTHQTMTPENVAQQMALAEASTGPVLAYCASGTRCSVVWALGQCPSRSPDEILSQIQSAGYQLDGLRPTLEALSQAASETS